MKQITVIIIICSCVAIFAFAYPPADDDTRVDETLSFIKKQSVLFAETTSALEVSINHIDPSDTVTIRQAKTALKKSRLQYKTIEFFLSYFLKSSTLVYNEANKFEVEEPFLEAREPTGFQVIESLLFSKDPALKKEELLQQVRLIRTSAYDINALLFNLEIDDKQILESIRIELIRIITLGITGFDTPELKSGITESRQALLAVQQNLAGYLFKTSKAADSVKFFLKKSIFLLGKNPDFNSFDRLGFLTKAALPLQYHLGVLIKENGLKINNSVVLNYEARNLFSKQGIVMPLISADSELKKLGRKLFSEKLLSQTMTRSCSSCHQPEKYFTDGLEKSISLDNKSVVMRNSPTLLYSTFQYAQFWDGRAKTIQEQVQAVLNNPTEMGSDHTITINRLKQVSAYRMAFKKVFKAEEYSSVNLKNISIAIEAFLSTLAPMTSNFDQYISNKKQLLSASDKRGFNLFMGKAQCGTCHYAPIFNGLVPPFYDRTEFEVLGLTRNINFVRPQLDTDSGRFATFPISYYARAFKTPTVRNIARTAPYMHNGAFKTLQQVMDFYNKGGAAGMGLSSPTQTLSPKPLNLSKKEIDDVISFMNALTDTQASWQ